MKSVLITELDNDRNFPYGEILKTNGEKFVGCAPKSFLNFFALLDMVEGLPSEFLLWLKDELQEGKDLITPAEAMRGFLKNPIWSRVENYGGKIYDHNGEDYLAYLAEGWVLFTVLFVNPMGEPAHCVLYHYEDGGLYADGIKIPLHVFIQQIYCHENNRFLIGRKIVKD